MNKILSSALIALASLGFASTSIAHHSNAPHFDTNVDISVNAVITKWAFVNPHAYMFFEGTDENGVTAEWRCESSSATSMERRGFDENTFIPGQKITIEGNPARREDNVCWINSFVFEDGVAVGGRDNLPEDKRSGSVQETVAMADIERSEYLDNGQPNIGGSWVRAGRGGPGAGAPPVGGGGPRGPQIDSTEAGLAAQATYEQIYDDPGIHCDIANIFFGWTHDSHVNDIAQEDNKVVMTYGYMDYVRTIHLDVEEHPSDITPTRGGHSIGHWEDKTLVVDSIGFTPGVLHPLSGISHSDQMHATERFWYDQESKTLIGTYSAEDPLYLSSPYTGTTTMNISAVPYEAYNCTEYSGDNNRRPEDRVGS